MKEITKLLIILFKILSIKESFQHVINTDKSDLELKLVHVIFRHGAKTPSLSYPKDPYKDEKYEPYGVGALTNTGKLEMFELGQYLRTRYDGFLPDLLKLDDIHAEASDLPRSKMSIDIVSAGLYPPKYTSLDWNPQLNWQPLPYSYEKLFKDNLLLMIRPCLRYYEELDRVFEEEVKSELDEYAEMFRELSDRTGWNITSHFKIYRLYGVLKCQEEMGKEIPEWSKRYYPEVLEAFLQRSNLYNGYNAQLKKLKGGTFLKKSIEDWDKKIENKLSQKMFLYSGHTSSVRNILLAFNAWQPQQLDYCITAFLELSQHKTTGKFGVQIFLRNSTVADPYLLEIEGCGKFCHLEDLKIILKENVPGNFEEECKPLDPKYVRKNDDF